MSITDQIKEGLLTAFREHLEKSDSREEAEKVIERFESLDLQGFFSNVYDECACETVSDMKKSMFEQVMRFRANDQEFISRQEQKWYRAFAASEAMYIMTLEAAEHYSKYADTISVEEAEPIKWHYVALRHIHGRALQIFLEIIALMKGGFADGAYARWRSLYELAIVSWFIKDCDEDVARCYCEAANSEDRYEWARQGLHLEGKKGYITFKDIKKTSSIDTDLWNDQYILANRIIHPSPQGTFGRIGDMGSSLIIPVGRTDYGIETPAVNAAISLAQITAPFFTVINHDDTIIAMKCIQQWIDVVREEYFKAHDEVFPDDDKLWEE